MQAFSVFGEYRCMDCGEVFSNRIAAVKHHMETKHENFELVACDISIRIKS